jgi:LmbE family N-acetylglucosaminyl deacetylase
MNNRNPDHTHTSMLVREASFTAGLVKYDTGQPPHRPNKIIYCMEYFDIAPTVIIDITGQYDRKMKAVACYMSQIHIPGRKGRSTYIASERFMKEMETRFRHFGSKIHSDYGEAFRLDTPVEIVDVVKEIALRTVIPGHEQGCSEAGGSTPGNS